MWNMLRLVSLAVLRASSQGYSNAYSAEDLVCRSPEDAGCQGEPATDSEDQSPFTIPHDWYQQNVKARKAIPAAHQPTVAIVKPLPRVSVEQLELPANEHFKQRRRPFILTGAMSGWRAMTTWPIDSNSRLQDARLVHLFNKQVTDFYPYNMLESGTHPFLYRFGSALEEILRPPGHFTDGHKHRWSCDEVKGCRYVHLQLTPSSWKQLETGGDIPPESKRHPHTGGDAWWMRRCLKDPAVAEEYHIKTHWKIILIGAQGSGMFNHSDSLMSSSWHGHFQGLKWWYVCGKNQGSGPNEGRTECFENVLKPGEILFYGKGWSHHTRNLETPTSTITGTVVTHENFEALADKLHSECAASAMKFDFSGALCDALDSCYPLWHKVLKGKDASTNRWPAWRTLASAQQIATKDAMKASENNYDGRNWIGG